MKMQPRQELLEIWRATAQFCYRNGDWHWGGRDGSDSISDAEQLLCLLQPATSNPRFALEQPDEMAEDALAALRAVGDAAAIPQMIIKVAAEYLQRYTAEQGTPVFSGGSQFLGEDGRAPDDAQATIDVVASYSTSITLSLAIIGFVRVFRSVVSRHDSVRRSTSWSRWRAGGSRPRWSDCCAASRSTSSTSTHQTGST